jgi:hypothetical protein
MPRAPDPSVQGSRFLRVNTRLDAQPLTIEGAGHPRATLDGPCADRDIERYPVALLLASAGALCADQPNPFTGS